MPRRGAQSISSHPRRTLTVAASRLAAAFLTLLLVSILVFWATQVLPGDAAYAVLGHNASQAQIEAMQAELGLNDPVLQQYWHQGRSVVRPSHVLHVTSPNHGCRSPGYRPNTVTARSSATSR